jgi:uncharacterized lipoprotein YddW (UPF0748 family)
MTTERMFRGIWLRPEASLSSVTVQLDNIQKAGFNAVYVETFYHGFTIFPSEHIPIRPEMEGTDYLWFYVEEGHKRGLEIHPWIEVFYWEVNTQDYPQFPKTTLFDNHPEWRALLRNGDTTDKEEKAHIFANPADPGVQELLLKYFEEILTGYDVDGLNLDYIRYPHGFRDAGYEEYTRAEYKQVSGKDPVEIEMNSDDPEWRAWVEWREKVILDFVAKVTALRDRVKRKVVLSAAVFPASDEDRYKSTKYQNWREMVRLQLLDVIAPMAYQPGLAEIEKSLRAVIDELGATKVQLMPALAIQKKNIDEYSGQGHPPVYEQEQLVRKLGLPGFSIFCYDWMMDSDEGLDLFKPGAAKPRE